MLWQRYFCIIPQYVGARNQGASGACYTLCSNKQQQNPEAEHDPQFDPVIKLEHQVEVKTHEEDEDVQFKMYVTC